MDLYDGRIVTNIIQAILYNDPVTIYGDGTQTRSLCYIDDMVQGLTRLMESSEIGPINLGNPDTEMSLNELIEEFERLVGFPIQRIYVERTENDPVQRNPDISLAKDRLGFHCKVSLDQGLRKTLRHFIYVTREKEETPFVEYS